MKPDGRLAISLRGGKDFLCELGTADSCVTDKPAQAHDASGKLATGDEPGVLSPDKKSEAFIRDWNLWLRDVATGRETRLTTDGVENFGYATDNAGWKHTDNAILEWSPDSSKIATFQQDQRKTGDMYLVSTNVGHPKLQAWKYPLPGDKDVTMIERVIIDVPTKKVVRLDMAPDQHRSTLCDDVSCGPDGGWDDVKWAPDGKTLAFVSTSRYHQHEWFRIADATTGKVRTVFEESVQDLPGKRQRQGQLGLPAGDPRGGLVLRAQQLGPAVPVRPRHRQAQARITSGEGNVTEMLKVDPKTRAPSGSAAWVARRAWIRTSSSSTRSAWTAVSRPC